MPVLQLGTSTTLRPPKKLYALGFPVGMQFGITPTPTKGSLASKLEDVHGQWLKFDGLISTGHSGGPVITEDGAVIGWNVRNARPHRGSSGLNHARPIEAASECLEALR